MPRASAESRAAASFRAGLTPPEPPRRLSAPARKLWQSIVADRPADFFRRGADELLASFCEMSVAQRKALTHLGKLDADDPEFTEASKTATALAKAILPIAKNLRLTVAAHVDRHSRVVDERGTDVEHDPLIGGAAVSMRTRN